MAQGTKCPFLSGLADPTCWKGDCRLWVSYEDHVLSGAECTFKLLSIMELPKYGATLEVDVD